MDPRHPKDTLFLFFEAHFRFWEEDCVSPDLWLPWAVQDRNAPVPHVDMAPPPPPVLLPQPASSSGASRPATTIPMHTESRQDAPPAVHPESGKVFRPDADGLPQYQRMQQKMRPFRELEDWCTQELVDVVQTATQAHRLGKGEVIWWGYCCGNKGQGVKKFPAGWVADPLRK